MVILGRSLSLAPVMTRKSIHVSRAPESSFHPEERAVESLNRQLYWFDWFPNGDGEAIPPDAK